MAEVAGVVVWDESVPATANLASTAAGVENLLPVRYDPTPGSPYHELVIARSLPVELDLVGMFTGEGTIPGTDRASTGSAKNDAYLWAKARWLDTGLTNPTLMLNALDAMSWSGVGSESSLQAVSVPARLQVGQEIAVSMQYVNKSQNTWTMGANDRLAADTGNNVQWGDLNGGYSQGLDNQRVFLDPEAAVAPGESVIFEFSITAPETPGEYIFSAGVVRDGVAWYSGTAYSVRVEVTAEPQSTTPADPAPPTMEASYPDLFNTGVYNADYYIAEKAFFFDLDPDATSIPNDDPDQELGTDHATLEELLSTQNALAQDEVVTVGGFVPWFLKYTTHVDPDASLAPVAMEWAYADLISGYMMQKDADAYGLVGFANASIYRDVPLADSFTQLNDKGENGETYVEGRKYLTFYMGDYDSAAWTAGTLPAFWNDPARGELPLAWPPNTSLSERVPQLFNYLYATQTENDYFVGGDNGVGYLNPMMLAEGVRPDGLPDGLRTWTDYNAAYYEQFDIDLTGFLISGNSGSVTQEVQEAYASFSPAGVGTNGGYDSPIVDGTPFMTVRDFPIETADAAVYGEQLAATMRGANDFHFIRDILVSPTLLLDAVQYVRDTYPELDFEVVDPYTNFRFYAEARPWENLGPTASAMGRTTPPSVDGVSDDGEWSGEDIVVSTEEETVVEYGRVWGSISSAQDITSRVQVSWDADNLYLREVRTDDALVFTATDSQVYSSDSIMFFLDMTTEQRASSYRDGDYALIVTADSAPGGPLVYLREGHESGAVERPLEVDVAVTTDEAGYTMELAVPWSELQTVPFVPEPDSTIGFSTLAIDADGPVEDWGQVMWVGDGDNQATWGTLRFTAPPTDLARLQELIVTARAQDPLLWTTASYQALETALGAAVAVEADASATQTQIDDGVVTLGDALSGLVPVDPDDGGNPNPNPDGDSGTPGTPTSPGGGEPAGTDDRGPGGELPYTGVDVGSSALGALALLGLGGLILVRRAVRRGSTAF